MSDSTIEEIEQLVTPFCYSPETPFPNFAEKGNRLKEYENGTIADSSDWGYIYSDRHIQCFPIDSSLGDCHHKSKLQVNLSIPTKPFVVPRGAYLKCVTEVSLFKPKSWGSGLNRLLLGFGCSTAAASEEGGDPRAQTGAVAIYDQVQQQILKWIPVPEPVTSMKVLAHWDSGESSKPFFNPAMMTMVGIVTIGMSGGRVLVVDIGLDRLVITTPKAGLLQPSVASMDSVQLHELIVVDPFDRQIATKRHYAIQSNALICFFIGDSSETSDFLYIVRDGQSAEYSANMDRNNLSVVVIDYVPNIGCLLVGFSFGGFQLWRMEELALMYSSVTPEVEVPVHSFGFQQPIDDPKNFCYVWVLYGSRFCDGPSPRLDLYQLFFLNKSQLENFGCIYQDLQKFVRNMSISLEDSFFALKAENSMDESLEESSRGRYPLRLTIRNELMFVSWKVDRVGVFYVGIFDLNAWYSSHTPSGIPSGFGIAPFWVAIPVERALESELWDFRVVPSSIQRWENKYQPMEFHSYPASITFQGACLTSQGYYTFDHFGVQEKIIRLLSKDGPLLMAEPSRLLQYCLLYGLQPRSTRVYDVHSISEKDAARFQILTVLLENKRPAIIVQMANAWLDGSYSNVGCSVNLILDWIRDLSLSVRSTAEQHWIDLFTVAQASLLPDTIDFIAYSNFVWNSLHSLLSILVRHDEVYNSARSGSLDSLRYSLKKLVEYSAAMQMFYQAKILPSDESALKIMNQIYVDRRQAVKDTRARMDFIPDDYKDKYGLLVIDELVSKLGEDLVRQEWKIDPEDYLYPPKHTAYVLNMLLWKDVDLGLVSRVMFYFIMDYICAAELPSSILKGDFGSVIQLDGEEHQEVYNMWRIDRGYVDEPLAYMVQHNVLAKPSIALSCWSAAMIILVGSDGLMESDVLNLLNLGCPIELPKLYYAILGRIPHMQDQLMKFFSNASFTFTPKEHDLVWYFVQVAYDQEFLHDFITRYLLRSSELVQELLLDFLRQEVSTRVKSLEPYCLLLNYYTTMGKTEEAERIHSTMKTTWGEGTLLSSKQKQMWAKLQANLRTGANQTKDSMVMSFLKNEVSANVPLSSPLAVKPKKYEVMQAVPKRLVSKPLFQSSPLRTYVPKMAKKFEDEESLEDENDVTIANNEEIEKLMDSLLRTPSVDHRRPRLSDAASRASSILSELSVHADTETHSILKKSPTKTPSKSRIQLKTRFIDPQSGQEILSPDHTTHAFVKEVEHPLENIPESLVLPNALGQEASVSDEAKAGALSYRKRLRSHSPSSVPDLDRNSKSPSPKRRSLRSPRLPNVQEEARSPTPEGKTVKSKKASPPTTPPKISLPVRLQEEVDVLQESISTPDKSIEDDVFLTPTSISPKGKKRAPSPKMSPGKAEITSTNDSRPELPFHVSVPEPVKNPGEVVISSENLLVDPIASKISVTEDHGALKTLDISLAFDTSKTAASGPVVTDLHNVLHNLIDQPRTGGASDVSNVNLFETTSDFEIGTTAMDVDTGSERAAIAIGDTAAHQEISPTQSNKSPRKEPVSRKRAKSTTDSPSPTSKKSTKRTKSEVSSPKRNVRRALVTDKVPRPKKIRDLESPVKSVNPELAGSELALKKSSPNEQATSVLKHEKVVVLTSKVTRTNLETGASASMEQTLKSESKAVTKTISPKKIEEVVLGGESLLTDDESDEDHKVVAKKKRTPRKKQSHEDSVDAASDSVFDKTSEDPLELGPRRLTRKQKTMLESIGMGEISSMGDANLTPPKHSPTKNKSPAKSGGRKRKGISGDDDASIGSSEHELEKTVTRRPSRRSMTPESDVSQVSARRVTRSSRKKTEDANSSIDETSDNVEPPRSTRSRRSKTPSANLTTIFEKTANETLNQSAAGLDESLSNPTKSRRKSTRAVSEPPVTQPKRKPGTRKKEVLEFEPNVSTIYEVSQERSTLEDSKLNTSSSRTRRQPSRVESIAEEPDAEMVADTSRTTRSTRARSTRRSMTPSLTLPPSDEDVTVAERVARRRHASTSSTK